jgi:hypothetical protein
MQSGANRPVRLRTAEVDTLGEAVIERDKLGLVNERNRERDRPAPIGSREVGP